MLTSADHQINRSTDQQINRSTDIAQAHTVDEWIAVTQLERATTILERFLLSLP
jgi:acetylornithine deacetylase/succinyl-diaminopimelate desuccinylase-like protein